MMSRRIASVAVTCTAALALAGVVGAQVVVQPGPPPPVTVTPAPPPPVVVKPTPPPTVVVEPTPPPAVVVEQTPSSTTIIESSKTTVTAPVPQVVQTGHIEANEVRAQTIYANKIKASDVKGAIHQTRDVKMSGRGSLKMPSVVASVIYAETIEARSVTADNIYVRDLDRR